MSKKIEKLKTLLNELFRLDQPDLDFGIYRIMNVRSEEITQYLEDGLLPQVKDAFEQYKSGDIELIENKIKIAIKGAKDAGFEPDDSPNVIKLRKKLADESIDLGSIENEVFDHLYNFFRRYYDKGDFLSKRIYKPGVYAIPYEGEEVKLHWANSDQYYVKTSEYLKNYSFFLQPDNDGNPMRVNFELMDADEGEHGNIKEDEEKKRRFQLAPEPFYSVENNKLIIRFTHESSTQKQDKINDQIQKSILDLKDTNLTRWIEKLKIPHTRKDGIKSSNNSLSVHLEGYTKTNNSDFFIHKDLGNFLGRELDFYIKNEVIHLDDIENELVPKVEQYLSKIKVIRNIATKIIQFLAQIENFQKSLWLKKKFIVETNYCITLDRVPEKLYPEIVANEAQCNEWIDLFAIDEMERNLFHRGYSKPLTIEFLNANNNLVLDSQFFDNEFKAKLIDSFEEFDEQCDGLLIHSDNFQALNLLKRRYEGKIDCLYADPPYNAKSSEIIYKNTFKHSNWLSFIADRIFAASLLKTKNGALITAIDENEQANLMKLLQLYYPNYVNDCITIVHNPAGIQGDNFSYSHEYAIFTFEKKSGIIGKTKRESESEESFRDWGGTSARSLAKNCFYPILVKGDEIIGFGDVCDDDYHPKKSNVIENGVTYVYPIADDGEERKWVFARDSVEAILHELNVKIINGIVTIKRIKTMTSYKTVWSDTKYYANIYGSKLLNNILGGKKFDFPKSVFTVKDCLYAVEAFRHENSVTLDYFSGSGTTAHAVIECNRVDGGKRKVILIEMGGHFDNVTKPRTQKIIYAKDWKNGKPKVRTQGVSYCFKYVRLESYEDTLNNLQLDRNDEQKSLFDFDGDKSDNDFKEQYILNYMLELESAGSQSLLNISDFMTPTEYKMNIKRSGSVESNVMNVDLIETFNWLIGITVKHLSKPQFITAEFKRDDEGRLCVNGELRLDRGGEWWFRTITGTLPDGRHVIIIWRNRPGGEDAEGVERDNLMLNEWFSKQKYDDAEGAFNLVYVNCSNNLEVLKKQDDNWSVRMIEDDFFNLMFE